VLELGFVMLLACADCKVPPSFELPIPAFCQQMANDYTAALILKQVEVDYALDLVEQEQVTYQRKFRILTVIMGIVVVGAATATTVVTVKNK
jgi:hypothetical protein